MPASTAASEDRQRLRELAEREIVVGQEFAKNIRDDVRTVELEPEQLDGLPDDYIAEHPVGHDGRVAITTDYPDVYPLLTFAHDRVARNALMLAFNNRAWPANDELLRELLELRAEHARLLGYSGWPDYDAEVKMIGAGDAIRSFIDQVTEAATEAGRRDRDRLLARLQQDDPDATTITRADSTLLRRADPSRGVRRRRAGGPVLLRLPPRPPGAARLHRPAVRADLPRGRGRAALARRGDGVRRLDRRRRRPLLGRIYLDLHPRDGQVQARGAVRDHARRRTASSCPRACWSATSRAD